MVHIEYNLPPFHCAALATYESMGDVVWRALVNYTVFFPVWSDIVTACCLLTVGYCVDLVLLLDLVCTA